MINKIKAILLSAILIGNIADASDVSYDFHGVFNNEYRGVGLGVNESFNILDSLNLDIGSNLLIGKVGSERTRIKSIIGCGLSLELNNNLKGYISVIGNSDLTSGGYGGSSVYAENSFIIGIKSN